MAKKNLIAEHIPKSVHPLFKDKLCYSVSKTGILLRILLENSLKEHDLMPPQVGILYILSGVGHYNQVHLGQEMSIDKASMVKYLDGLEKLKFVERITDTQDRRAKLVHITALGRKFAKKIAAKHAELEEKFLEGFTKTEVETLRKLMPRLMASVINCLEDRRL
ncbi:MAG: MarR family winged helix-turn-helix transcriptional regulator [Bacteriovoracaceae bacterium]